MTACQFPASRYARVRRSPGTRTPESVPTGERSSVDGQPRATRGQWLLVGVSDLGLRITHIARHRRFGVKVPNRYRSSGLASRPSPLDSDGLPSSLPFPRAGSTSQVDLPSCNPDATRTVPRVHREVILPESNKIGSRSLFVEHLLGMQLAFSSGTHWASLGRQGPSIVGPAHPVGMAQRL